MSSRTADSPLRVVKGDRRVDLGEAEERHEPDVEYGGLSHDGMALEMGDTWSDARYVDAWHRWYFFNGSHWAADESLSHLTRCREFLRAKAEDLEAWSETKAADHPEEAGKIRSWAGREAKKLRSAPTVAQVVSLARSNEDLAARVGQWDADPWLLATPTGTVDLRTGEIREARPDDYITRSTAVGPAPPGTRAPRWMRFLRRTTDGDDELIGYKQRLYGYCLTGVVDEHVLVLLHGQGANGKTVEMNTMLGITGDYGLTIPTEMLVASPTERHPTEIARLRGVRLAVGSETEAGTRWAEAKLKRLTGGDRIPARFMRGDFFEFSPQFKLVVVGNHLPALTSVNEAIRRRLHLVPFTVVIPPEERDPKLERKLRREWPAILRWMIDGTLEWQARGLDPPEAVRAATEEYLEGEDPFGSWLADCWTDDPDGWVNSATLFRSWVTWAKDDKLPIGSERALGMKLGDLGYRRAKKKGKRGRLGLRRSFHGPVSCRPEGT